MQVNQSVRRLLFASLICAISSFLFIAEPAHAIGTFNVKNFGATGNGTTDDTTAIRATITRAEQSPGSTVLFPAGTYLYSNDLTIDRITLLGQNATLLSANALSDVEILGANANVLNLTFDTEDKSASGRAVYVLPTSSRFKIQNNKFLVGFFEAVRVQNASNGQVLSNTFTVTQVHSAAGVELLDSARSISVENNVFNGSNNLNPNILDVGVQVLDSSGIGVTKNSFQGVFSGMYVQGSQSVNLQANTTRNCLHACRSVDCTSVNVVSNRFVWTQIISGSVGCVCQAGHNILVQGNEVSLASTGISLFNTTATKVLQNDLLSSRNFGVFADSAENLTIQRNEINECRVGVIVAGIAVNIEINGNIIKGADHGAISTGGTNVQVNRNMCSFCGARPEPDVAVIFVNPAGTCEIAGNTYTGGKNNLTYFIHCIQSSPPAKIFGNSNDAMLPDRIGS
jgi:nitrous oxidase accessory protein NosD